ncbi:MAG: prepilin-type N-terminal cleavage/methylation domain-containing protein [Opitutus sp.]|nr:prepilin-type N-terminal cleavage/methylation domain-containing protein [Opitutus sp.]
MTPPAQRRPNHGRTETRKRCRAFTLIELLTVIAIIGILAGILIPTVSGVRNSAKKAETKVRFSQWAAAMEQFKQEYGYYPAVTTNNLLDPTKFLAALTGRDYTGTALSGPALNGNTKAISFYSISESEFAKDAAGNAVNELVDAYGNRDIVVLFDSDGNGVIRGTELSVMSVRVGNSQNGYTASFTPGNDDLPLSGIRAGIILYSAGKGSSAADLIFSWK